MIRWNLTRLRKEMRRRDIANASQLATFAKLTKPTAGKVLSGDAMGKVDVPTWEALADAFALPFTSLIERRPDPVDPDI
jgi:hypothetical protein